MPHHQRWIQVSLSLPISYHDLLVGQLTELGFKGFQQEDDSLLAFLPDTSWNNKKLARLKTIVARFVEQFPDLCVEIHTRSFRTKNWNLLWERSTGIVDATRSIIIKPSWATLRKKDKGKIVIHIDPKMSFGTGHHATTRLCLELLEDHLTPGMRVLDFGTGTGILAIAAHKLGAGEVIAMDNDPWAIDNARENFRNNKLKSVRLLHSSRIPRSLSQFDLILANIDLPTISKHFRSLLAHLRPNGFLIVSGLLQSDLSTFVTLLEQARVTPIALLGEDGWAALSLLKGNAGRSH